MYNNLIFFVTNFDIYLITLALMSESLINLHPIDCANIYYISHFLVYENIIFKFKRIHSIYIAFIDCNNILI